MLIKPEIVINSRPNDYQRNADLLALLIKGVSANIYFVSPSPDVPTLTAALNSLNSQIAEWGPKGNRGSKATLLALRQQSTVAYRLIKAEVQYISGVAEQNAGGDMAMMASMMSTCGLTVRTERHPQGLLGKVQNIRSVKAIGLNHNQVEWLWSRPLGVTSKKNVRFYKVFRNTVSDFSTAQMVSATPKARHLETNDSGEVVTYTFWFLAVTAHGDGTLSDGFSITLLPL